MIASEIMMLTNAAPKSPTCLASARVGGRLQPDHQPGDQRQHDCHGPAHLPVGFPAPWRVPARLTKLAPAMLATELELPTFDHTDPTLRGDRYRDAMAALDGHDGWLASNPFGFTCSTASPASSSCAPRTRCSPG